MHWNWVVNLTGFSTNELISIKNELYIADFYNINKSGANVVNVSSIIGKNGTGKSSILNFLKNNLSSGLNLQEEIILVYKENDVYKMIATSEFKYDSQIITEIQLFKKKKPEKEIDHFFDFGYEFKGFPNTDFVYFSNVFDGTPGGSLHGLYDISTNCLIFEDYKMAILQGTASKNANQVGVHLIEDIFRQLKFLTNDISKDKITFQLPEEIGISVNLDYLLYNTASQKDNEFQKEFDNFKNLVLNEYASSNDEFNQSLKVFICYVLLNLVKELITVNVPSEEHEFKIKYNSNFILSKDKIPLVNLTFDDCVQSFFEEIKKQLDNLKYNFPSLKQLIGDNQVFIKYIIDNQDKFENSYLNSQESKIFIDIKNENIIDKFLELYLKTYTVNSYLNFEWRSISSGEKALLNIYSRFFSISDSHKFGQKLAKNVIILIDEGDVYLHPSWQKKFVKNILEYLPVIFSRDEHGNKRNLQIIFTTNSPIPASDLLSYSTIFLERTTIEINGKSEMVVTVKDSLNDQKQTFAANIHTLLSDSFFIKDGLIGDFAALKINSLIKDLINKVDINKIDRESIRLLIHQIGEPIIKHKLMQMYNERFNLEIHERLDIIEKKLNL
ncbi:AAA family ATPase [Flavobacterium sp. Arc3]|uniref:AAA family ATPase n=1 Tax=Flavobacterium sp. Arc3 TaxID=3046686 RepID=UPI00352E7275